MLRIGKLEFKEKPLLLAPMEDVSDPPFRALCKKFGADLMYTEFISTEGLIRNADKSVQKLDIFDYERPIGIQIFGGEEEPMRISAEIVEEAKPDILDINYGCPVKKVVCKDAGAGILKNIPKMMKLTKAVIDNTKLPVTVKTRLGWDDDTIQIESVAEQLQDLGVQALSIHARTRTQMYKGLANWDWLKRVKDNPRISIPIFGNGDVDSPEKAKEMMDLCEVDGVMIGRAAIGYPWIFREIKHYLATGEHLAPPTLEERVDAVKFHLEKSIEWKGERVGLNEMKRHYTNYFRGYKGIKEYRAKLVTSMDPDEIRLTLDSILAANLDPA